MDPEDIRRQLELAQTDFERRLMSSPCSCEGCRKMLQELNQRHLHVLAPIVEALDGINKSRRDVELPYTAVTSLALQSLGNRVAALEAAAGIDPSPA